MSSGSHHRVEQNDRLPIDTFCILNNLRDERYKDRMCTIDSWVETKQRYVVNVDMGTGHLVKILVPPGALTVFSDMFNRSTENGSALFKLDRGMFNRVNL